MVGSVWDGWGWDGDGRATVGRRYLDGDGWVNFGERIGKNSFFLATEAKLVFIFFVLKLNIF
jgi:hypothetical protein